MNPFENENNPEQLIAAAAAALDNKELKTAALKRLLMIATNPEQIVKGFLDYTEAIEKTQKSGILSPLVMNNQNLLMSMIMSTAVRELNDQEIIARLVTLRLFKLEVLRNLIEKCTDEKALKATVEFGKFDAADAGSLAAAAAQQIKDQKYLVELLIDKRLSIQVREVAAWQVEDQKVLEKILNDTSDVKGIRSTVAEHITDQKILKNIIESNDDNWVRQGAICGITDQSYLEHIACTNKEEKIREAATRRIESPDVALKIFQNDESIIVKSAAIKKVNNQQIIFEAALTATALGVKMGAEESLTDEELCKQLYLKRTKDEFARKMLIKKIKDQNFLADVVYNDNSISIRSATLNLITDPYILNEIFQYHKDPAIKANIQNLVQKNFNEFTPSTEPTAAQNLAEAALQLIDKGQIEDARKAALASIIQDPNLAKPRMILADLEAKVGNYQESAKQYGEFLKIEPFFAFAWRALALVQGKLGEASTSADMMQRAAALEDDIAKNALAVEERGDTCSFCKQQVSALQTAIAANGVTICVNCVGLATKVMAANVPFVPGKKRRGLITEGTKPCNFCGKSEYRTLVDGGAVAICDGCVDGFFGFTSKL